MNFDFDCNLKYKLISEDDILLSLDRLTRFKNPEIKYKRVFYDIILKHLAFPSLSKHKLDELPASFIASAVQEIWNESVASLYKYADEKFTLKQLDEVQYDIKDEYTNTLMSANLQIAPVIKSAVKENSPLNLIFLSLFYKNYRKNQDLISFAKLTRHEKKTLYPIQKLILTEGITEEILLPQFGKVIGYDFFENGIYVLATGGKSKVLSLYAELKYILKIPIFVLLDNDAKPVYDDVISVLREQDRAYLIKSGEFEDILQKELIQKAFSEMNYDTSPAKIEELSSIEGTCHALENLWKSRGLGEFRKAHLAKAVSICFDDKKFVTPEIENIIGIIKNL